ncbi:MAG: hypothetical protein Q8930_17755, partial [Bacillota bacterium]|nr:hypothetical protein [Bacillota bacterium]
MKGKTGFMFWYMRIGRVIYGALFILVFILTIIQLVSKGTGIFTAVFLDLAWGLVGVFLELKLMRCREQ